MTTTRIVVAADNRSLSLGLAGLDYDVVDISPSQLTKWGATEAADVLVVGIDDAADAIDLVRQFDGVRPGMPSLVVCGDPRGWEAQPVDGLNIEVLPLPVTRPSLVAAIQRLTTPVAERSEPPSAPLEEIADVAVVPATPAVTKTPVTEKTAPPARHIVAARSTNALRERLANTSHDRAPRSSATVDEELAQLRARADVPRSEASSTQETSAATAPLVAASGVADVVRSLLARSPELYDVRDAARAVLEESAAKADVLAAVVLLPDGDVWRVCAAIGARPLEWRYVLEPDSWVVTTVVDGNRGVIVEESDIARQRLGGAPLAHHKHLMIVPIVGPRGVIVLARESEPFTEAELTAIAQIAADAGRVLSDGVAVRDLARALSDFRGLDD
jgi:hypothetical protein